MKDAIITIGFDKNGQADFGIRGDIVDLSLEDMNELRRMIPVAIGVAEDMFRRAYAERGLLAMQLKPPTEERGG